LRKSNLSWESFIEHRATIANDIDENTIQRFLELSGNQFASTDKENSIEYLLEKLHLLDNGKLTRAAILLFGKNPQKFYAGSFIKIGRAQNDSSVQSMDEVSGNLFHQVEEVVEILKKKYLHSEITITSLRREEELEFPEVALREAIVNAIVHRDYSAVHTQIKVFPDYLSIWNNGELPNKLSIEKLKMAHSSFPRNEKIAAVFFKSGYIEAWGTGTVKMIQKCKEAGLPEPIYEETSGGVQVTFLKDIFNEDYINKQMLNDRQIKAILHLKEHGRINNTEYQRINETSKRTASNDLQELTEKGLIQKIGATGKGTQYVLQRGNKGAKGAKTAENDLDRRLRLLEEELAIIDPNEEIQVHFNNVTFFKMLDTWISEYLVELIEVAQKFNRLFNDPSHNVYTSNFGSSGAYVKFINEAPREIVSEFRKGCKEEDGHVRDNARVELALRFGTFRKGGLKTFGCNYIASIEFDSIKYRVLIDDLAPEGNARKPVLKYERLLHQEITSEEIRELSEGLGNTLLGHIEYHTKKIIKGQ
jgi:ATP-dependent DNA helicase RecG